MVIYRRKFIKVTLKRINDFLLKKNKLQEMNIKIVHISMWEMAKLHFLSFTYGLYLIMKRFLQWAWNPNKFFVLQQRDKPPQCLVDNSLGEHSYVKLKVSFKKYINYTIHLIA